MSLVFKFKPSKLGMREQFEVAQLVQIFFLMLIEERLSGQVEAIKDEFSDLLRQLRTAMHEACVEVATPSWFAELL